MTARAPLRLKFWGVRGSIPTPERKNLGYGGNTACVEVCHGEGLRLILDAGSGLRRLGLSLRRDGRQGARAAHLLLSHFHWDHVQGIPFFAPLYSPEWELAFYSALPVAHLESAIATQTRAPHFPAESAIRARREYRQVGPGGVRLEDVLVEAFPLYHPGGSVGYRIGAPHAAIVYAPDHEHGEAASDARLCEFARGADALIYDAQFTPEEYESRKGWGHGTWAEGVRVAREADVKRLILFHHDPERDDDGVTRIVDQARAGFENTFGAKEGWSLEL